MPWKFLYRCFFRVLPLTQLELNRLKARALQIPDPELRRQALSSLEKKQFHADGGAVFASLMKQPDPNLVAAIVAFQTISDYLDNLCDRSTSLCGEDFARLHESMLDAVSLDAPVRESGYYYQLHPEQEDGGYLAHLVNMIQDSLRQMPEYPQVADLAARLTGLYCDLQIHKHVEPADRVKRLQAWFERAKAAPGLEQLLGFRIADAGLHWWEFAAACGSTLGVFALWTQAVGHKGKQDLNAVGRSYFPWITGLHILLDYWIDQEEDRQAGDLNFFTYYPSTETAYQRLCLFVENARASAKTCPSPSFHTLVVEGLVGMYLSDRKASSQPGHEQVETVIGRSGWVTKLFYQASGYYRRKTHHM